MRQSTAMIYAEFPLQEWPDTLAVLLLQNFTATSWLADLILVWIVCSFHIEVVSGRDMNTHGLNLFSAPEASCFKNSLLKEYFLTLGAICWLTVSRLLKLQLSEVIRICVLNCLLFFLSLRRWSLKSQKAGLATTVLENQHKRCILSCQTSCKKSNAVASRWKSSIGLFGGAWQDEKVLKYLQ